MDNLFNRFPFLSSTRFWAFVLIGVSIAFNDLGYVSDTLLGFIITVCGGHVGVRTIDRFGENFNNKKK